MASIQTSRSTIPAYSHRLCWGFRRYVRRFVKKNFNAVRVAGANHVHQLPKGPLICFVNHPSWWDPMTAVLMTQEYFPHRRFAAPMDAQALRQYPILERMGFFPVERDSIAGAKEFLRTSRELLKVPDVVLWLTPTGKFCDVRQSAPFMNGLSHLVDREFAGSVVAAAIEYTFWNERFPELLVEFHSPLPCHDLPDEKDRRTLAFEECLSQTQALLASRAIERDPTAFHTLASGTSGIGLIYDTWRRLTAWGSGKQFRGRHDNDTIVPTAIRRDL